MYAQQSNGGGLLEVVLVIVLALTALTQYGCEPQPVYTLLEQRQQAEAAEADRAAEAVYGAMSDAERLRGVVYD